MDFLDQENINQDAFMFCDFNDDQPIDEFPFIVGPSSEFFFNLTPPPSRPPSRPPPPIQPTSPVENNQPQNYMTYDEFCQYINSKIDPNDAIRITKEMLMNLEKPFVEEFHDEWIKLTRNDKRKKEKIMEKFYENANIMYNKLENEPDKYLRFVKESIIKKYANKI